MSACPRAAAPVQPLQWERPLLLEKWRMQQVQQVLRWPRALLPPPGHRPRQAPVPWGRSAPAQ
ncbi:hypothetical protein ACE15N_00240 [Xanthomonas campestris pv. passiflorae]|uniref:hypothetical protein n=1 Tax=Xanthomonas campestris TaxID=339 RepID=UPI002423D7DC|nr:hypothetical protein [Xanthomonas campestris]MBV6816037.1 hypothetical protein [Xanthomonas campestris pv. passiflorae]